MIAPGSAQLPSDHVMSDSDYRQHVGALMWIRRYLSDALAQDTPASARGSIAAARLAAENELARIGAPICQPCDGSGGVHRRNGRDRWTAGSPADMYDDVECSECSGTGISTEA